MGNAAQKRYFLDFLVARLQSRRFPATRRGAKQRWAESYVIVALSFEKKNDDFRWISLKYWRALRTLVKN